MIYIYKHRNNINGKVYIGQTNNIKDRWQPGHYKKSRLFYRAIQKYGWENFTHEILSEIEDQTEADNQEIALIEYFDSTNPEKGYNITSGGGGTRGFHLSEDTKKKISISLKGKLVGCKNPMYGRKAAPLSEESIEKIRKAHLGKKRSPDTIKKISYNSSHRSPKTLKKMRDNHADFKLENHPQAKSVVLIDIVNNTEEKFDCIKSISKKYPELNYSSIRRHFQNSTLFKNKYYIKEII